MKDKTDIKLILKINKYSKEILNNYFLFEKLSNIYKEDLMKFQENNFYWDKEIINLELRNETVNLFYDINVDGYYEFYFNELYTQIFTNEINTYYLSSVFNNFNSNNYYNILEFQTKIIKNFKELYFNNIIHKFKRIETKNIKFINPLVRIQIRNMVRNNPEIKKKILNEKFNLKEFIYTLLENFFPNTEYLWFINKNQIIHIYILKLVLKLFEYGIWNFYDLKILIKKIYICAEVLIKYEENFKKYCLSQINNNIYNNLNKEEVSNFLIKSRILFSKIIIQVFIWTNDFQFNKDTNFSNNFKNKNFKTIIANLKNIVYIKNFFFNIKGYYYFNLQIILHYLTNYSFNIHNKKIDKYLKIIYDFIINENDDWFTQSWKYINNEYFKYILTVSGFKGENYKIEIEEIEYKLLDLINKTKDKIDDFYNKFNFQSNLIHILESIKNLFCNPDNDENTNNYYKLLIADSNIIHCIFSILKIIYDKKNNEILSDLLTISLSLIREICLNNEATHYIIINKKYIEIFLKILKIFPFKILYFLNGLINTKNVIILENKFLFKKICKNLYKNLDYFINYLTTTNSNLKNAFNISFLIIGYIQIINKYINLENNKLLNSSYFDLFIQYLIYDKFITIISLLKKDNVWPSKNYKLRFNIIDNDFNYLLNNLNKIYSNNKSDNEIKNIIIESFYFIIKLFNKSCKKIYNLQLYEKIFSLIKNEFRDVKKKFFFNPMAIPLLTELKKTETIFLVMYENNIIDMQNFDMSNIPNSSFYKNIFCIRQNIYTQPNNKFEISKIIIDNITFIKDINILPTYDFELFRKYISELIKVSVLEISYKLLKGILINISPNFFKEFSDLHYIKNIKRQIEHLLNEFCNQYYFFNQFIKCNNIMELEKIYSFINYDNNKKNLESFNLEENKTNEELHEIRFLCQRMLYLIENLYNFKIDNSDWKFYSKKYNNIESINKRKIFNESFDLLEVKKIEFKNQDNLINLFFKDYMGNNDDPANNNNFEFIHKYINTYLELKEQHIKKDKFNLFNKVLNEGNELKIKENYYIICSYFLKIIDKVQIQSFSLNDGIRNIKINKTIKSKLKNALTKLILIKNNNKHIKPTKIFDDDEVITETNLEKEKENYKKNLKKKLLIFSNLSSLYFLNETLNSWVNNIKNILIWSKKFKQNFFEFLLINNNNLSNYEIFMKLSYVFYYLIVFCGNRFFCDNLWVEIFEKIENIGFLFKQMCENNFIDFKKLFHDKFFKHAYQYGHFVEFCYNLFFEFFDSTCLKYNQYNEITFSDFYYKTPIINLMLKLISEFTNGPCIENQKYVESHFIERFQKTIIRNIYKLDSDFNELKLETSNYYLALIEGFNGANIDIISTSLDIQTIYEQMIISIKNLYNEIYTTINKKVKNENYIIQNVNELIEYYKSKVEFSNSNLITIALNLYIMIKIISKKNKIFENFWKFKETKLNNLLNQNNYNNYNNIWNRNDYNPINKENLIIYQFIKEITIDLEVYDNDQDKTTFLTFKKLPECFFITEQIKISFYNEIKFNSIETKLRGLVQNYYFIQYEAEGNYYIYSSNKNLYKFSTNDTFIIYQWIIYLICIIMNLIFLYNSVWDTKLKLLVINNMVAYYFVLFFNIFIIILCILILGLWIYTNFEVNEKIYLKENPLTNNYYKNILIYSKIYFTMFFLNIQICMFVYHLLFSLFYIFGFNLFISWHLFMVIFLSKLLFYVIKSLQVHFDQLILTILLSLWIIYSFTIILFNNYQDDINFTDELNQEICATLYECFINSIDHGFRNGGGVSEIMEEIDYSNKNFFGRFFFDLGFFFIINIIFLNIVAGIIIDTFASLRDEERTRRKSLLNECYICGDTKHKIEEIKLNFIEHIRETHNVFNYIYFIIYLKKSNPDELSGLEYKIFNSLDKNDISWFPKGTSVINFKENPIEEISKRMINKIKYIINLN